MKQFVFNKKKTDLNDAEVNDDSTYLCLFSSIFAVSTPCE